MTIPEDIRQRVEQDFGTEQTEPIYDYLLEQIPDGLPNGTRPRHLRCILYLAKGDKELLDQAIALCLSDPRDVMLNAEYEDGPRGGLVRKRDFSKPFEKADLPRRKK